MVAVRRHLLWWRAPEQLSFLCNLSQFLMGKRHLAERLNTYAVDVLPGGMGGGAGFMVMVVGFQEL